VVGILAFIFLLGRIETMPGPLPALASAGLTSPREC